MGDQGKVMGQKNTQPSEIRQGEGFKQMVRSIIEKRGGGTRHNANKSKLTGGPVQIGWPKWHVHKTRGGVDATGKVD